MIRLACKVVARIILLMMSGVHVNQPKKKVDYSRYLGPEWKPNYERPGTVISNHQSFMDIICHMYCQPPSHVSKASVLNIPFVGPLAEAVACLFIDRSDKE